MNPTYSRNKLSYAFTLIELLVVIAIIAILAAILFPVFAQAKESARKASCISNIKNVSLAFMMYCDAYDDVIPPENTGSGTARQVLMYGYDTTDTTFTADYSKGTLQPYMQSNRSITSCPSAADLAISVSSSEWALSSYAVNINITPVSTSEFPAPSETILVGDVVRILGNPLRVFKPYRWGFYNGTGSGYAYTFGAQVRHVGEMAVIGWYDGHATAKKINYRLFGNSGSSTPTVRKEDYENNKFGDVLKYPRKTVTYPTSNISCFAGTGSPTGVTAPWGACSDWYYLELRNKPAP